MAKVIRHSTDRAVRKRLGNLVDFINWKQPDLRVTEVKPSIIYDLEHYFGKIRAFAPDVMARHIKELRAVLQLSVLDGHLERNPLETFTHTSTPKPKEYLTLADLERLRTLKSLDDSERLERDIFLFQIITGLSHIDLANLTEEQVKKTPDGLTYLDIRRQKSGVQAFPILDDECLETIERYRDHPKVRRTGRLLPVNENQHRNRVLKYLARSIDLSFPLTTKTARDSHADLMLNEYGIPPDVVAASLGHSNSKTTLSLYARLKPETVARAVSEAKAKKKNGT